MSSKLTIVYWLIVSFRIVLVVIDSFRMSSMICIGGSLRGWSDVRKTLFARRRTRRFGALRRYYIKMLGSEPTNCVDLRRVITGTS